jgi:hypothetical protein
MPKKTQQIDWDDVDKLCEIQCTAEEIAGFYDMSVDTLDRKLKAEFGMGFAEYLRKKSSPGKVSLRRMMWIQANKGSVHAQIWLSKNYLGMKDKSDDDKYRDMRPIVIETSAGTIKLGMSTQDGKLHNDESEKES